MFNKSVGGGGVAPRGDRRHCLGPVGRDAAEQTFPGGLLTRCARGLCAARLNHPARRAPLQGRKDLLCLTSASDTSENASIKPQSPTLQFLGKSAVSLKHRGGCGTKCWPPLLGCEGPAWLQGPHSAPWPCPQEGSVPEHPSRGGGRRASHCPFWLSQRPPLGPSASSCPGPRPFCWEVAPVHPPSLPLSPAKLEAAAPWDPRNF